MALNIIFDILLVGILLGGAILGILKGFIKILSKPLKPIFSIVIALSLCGAVASAIVEPIISEPVSNQISGFLYENCENLTPENFEEELPTLIRFAATTAGIDVNELLSEGEDVVKSVVDTLIAPVIRIISTIVAFVLIYIAARLLVSLAFCIINAVFNAGVFKVLNKTLGFITSFLMAVFISWAFVSVIEYVIHFPAFVDSALVEDFTGGAIYNLFKQYNPVELLLSF